MRNATKVVAPSSAGKHTQLLPRPTLVTIFVVVAITKLGLIISLASEQRNIQLLRGRGGKKKTFASWQSLAALTSSKLLHTKYKWPKNGSFLDLDITDEQDPMLMP